MIISEKIFVRHAGAKPEHGIGILAVGVVQPGLTPLVLLVDLQSLNKGASLTNSAESVISFFYGRFRAAIVSPEMIEWVEVDSMGMFDLMTPRWDEGICSYVDWQPLKYGPHNRTLDAFLGAYGKRGDGVWKFVQQEIEQLQHANHLAIAT